MNTIDLTPFYRSSVGFDRLGSLIDSAMRSEQSAGYPPYNIEVVGESQYAITLALAGFDDSEIDIQTEKGVLTVKGKKETKNEKANYLHQGIANRSFERKFNLADYVEVSGASLDKGLLTIHLLREIPEAMKPKKIAINSNAGDTLSVEDKVANQNNGTLENKVVENKVVENKAPANSNPANNASESYLNEASKGQAA